jgi:hypothetical protein
MALVQRLKERKLVQWAIGPRPEEPHRWMMLRDGGTG